MKRPSLTVQIFISLLAGALQGYADALQTYVAPIGTIFLNLLKFIVVPLVLISIICGIISISDISKVGRLGLRSLVYFIATTVAAVILGLGISTLVKGWFPAVEIPNATDIAPPDQTFMDQIVNIFPNNAFEPLVSANMMQVIVIAVLVGYAIVKVGSKAKALQDVINSANDVLTAILGFIMRLTPIGVFCIIAPVVASHGIAVFKSYAALIGITYTIFLIHMLVVFTPAVGLLGRVNPLRFFKEMLPAMLFAYSSDSSVATLPVTMRCTQKLGVPKSLTDFILPLGATINMNGVAIYLGVVSVFVANCCGMELNIHQYLALAFASTVASVGTPGVPGGSLALMAMVFASAGIPIEGVAIVAGIDRIIDMARTTMSITGDASCAIVVNAFEKSSSE